MRDPEVVAGSPHRANLAFEVMEISGADRLRAMARFVKRLRRPGIIYCATTKAVDDLYGALRLLRMPVHHYHGRMTAKERNAEQELYMKPRPAHDHGGHQRLRPRHRQAGHPLHRALPVAGVARTVRPGGRARRPRRAARRLCAALRSEGSRDPRGPAADQPRAARSALSPVGRAGRLGRRRAAYRTPRRWRSRRSSASGRRRRCSRCSKRPAW